MSKKFHWPVYIFYVQVFKLGFKVNLLSDDRVAIPGLESWPGGLLSKAIPIILELNAEKVGISKSAPSSLTFNTCVNCAV